MNRGKNPYPEFLIDEVSGTEVADIRHKIWAEGYDAGRKDRRLIETVIKTQSGMAWVFDEQGEQIPEYQGHYEKVKPHILKDAPPRAVFNHAFDYNTELKTVPRDKW